MLLHWEEEEWTLNFGKASTSVSKRLARMQGERRYGEDKDLDEAELEKLQKELAIDTEGLDVKYDYSAKILEA